MSGYDIALLSVLIALGFSAGITALVFAFVRRQRLTLAQALHDYGRQQSAALQQLAASAGNLQRRQYRYEQQLQESAEEAVRLRQDIAILGKRLEREQAETPVANGSRVLH